MSLPRVSLYFVCVYVIDMNDPDSELGGVNSTSHFASTFGALLFRTKNAEISLEAYRKQKNVNAIVQFWMDQGPEAITIDVEAELKELRKSDLDAFKQLKARITNEPISSDTLSHSDDSRPVVGQGTPWSAQLNYS